MFINVGGRASVPDMPGIDSVPYLTNGVDDGADRGARAIWWSSAAATSAWSSRRCIRRFGAEVTVVEKGPRLIGREDADVSAAMHDILRPRASPSA